MPHVEEMSKALRSCGRDIVFSLSNSAPFEHAADFSRLANCWRTTGDIWDRWEQNASDWQYGVSEIGFNQDRWAPFAASRPLERPRHAGRRPCGLGPGSAPDQAHARRAIFPHQPLVPALGPALDRLRHGAA